MKWSLALCMILTALIFCSTRCESGEPCPEDIICSMVYKSISVEIVDGNGEHVELSRAELRSEHLDHQIDVLAESAAGTAYQIISDGHIKFLDHLKARTFIFNGWIDDSLVVKEYYKIRHDCCHVVLESGSERIIIENQNIE